MTPFVRLDGVSKRFDAAVAADGITLDRRSEEHTSELQSRLHLVCRLLLEKKKNEGHDHEKKWYYWISLISYIEDATVAGLLMSLFALRFKSARQRYLSIYFVGSSMDNSV